LAGEVSSVFCRKLPSPLAQWEKDQGQPQAQVGAADRIWIRVKTLQEPRIGPLEPFEIADVR
jgi:hypothetical protein